MLIQQLQQLFHHWSANHRALTPILYAADAWTMAWTVQLPDIRHD